MDEIITEKIKSLRSLELTRDYLKDLKAKKATYLARIKEIEGLSNERLEMLDKLDGHTFLGTYLTITGRKHEAMEVSRQFYLDLVLEKKDLLAMLKKIDFELQVLGQKTADYASLKREVKELLTGRDEEIKSSGLRELSKTVKKLDYNHALLREFDEAIEAGVEVNKKFNAVLSYIKKIQGELNKILFPNQKPSEFDLSKMAKYQAKIIDIRHSMIKFETEVNDIYKQLFRRTGEQFELGDNFLKDHRRNFFSDLQSKSELANCKLFLESQKAVIQSFVRVLRKDKRRIEKEISQLEKKEQEIIDSIKQ